MILDPPLLREGGADLRVRIELAELPVGIAFAHERVESVEIQAQVEVVDESLFAVADVHEGGIQRREDLLDFAKEDVPDRIALTLVRFTVQLDQPVILQQRDPNLGGRDVHHQVFFCLRGFHCFRNCINQEKARRISRQAFLDLLFLLVAVQTQALLTLVRSHLMSLMLLSVRHNYLDLGLTFSLTAAAKDLAGLKAGMQ